MQVPPFPPVSTVICMYVCYVCVCVYVCMYVWIFTSLWKHIPVSSNELGVSALLDPLPCPADIWICIFDLVPNNFDN